MLPEIRLNSIHREESPLRRFVGMDFFIRINYDFISEKGCLEGTSEIFEKNKVQREKWPVPLNGPPVQFLKDFQS